MEPIKTESSASETGDALNEGAGNGALPKPVTLIVSGLPAALWLIINLANLAPIEVGVNLTVKPWPVPAATAAFVGETLNTPASVPETAMAVMAKLAVPVLAAVTTF